MTTVTHPPKEQVRQYMQARTRTESPPPAAIDIRRQLGWYLVPENGPVPEVPD